LQPGDLKFDDRGLLPAVVQDAGTREVLMLAWVDEEAVRRTLESKTTWFWSRSRSEYWNKGATSGNLQHLVDLRYDCDADAVLMLVNADGPACHTGEVSCFYRSFPGE
jgi:phosphoribosyl-ATP pyrophosphohydrolase/phosphoribosyl-AMP cyclohydrolase